MASQNPRRRRIRVFLSIVILLSLACYCLGFAVLQIGQLGKTTATPATNTPSATASFTSSPARPSATLFSFPSQTPTLTATITWTPSQTYTPFTPPSATPSSTPTPTASPLPTSTHTPIPPSSTPIILDTLTPTRTTAAP